MRIGYDAKRLFNNFTGLGNYSRFIVGGIHDFFPQEDIFLFTPKAKDHPEVNVFKEAAFTTVLPASLLTTLKLGSYWRSFLLQQEAKRHRLDLYHGLSHELPRGISSVTKSVVTIHDLIFLRFPQFYKPIDRWIYTTKIEYACKEADCIVAISEQTKNDLVEFLNVPAEKIRVVYQGCHPTFNRKFSREQQNQIKAKYRLPDHFLLNVGTIESRKNALLILQALEELGDATSISLVIVGRPTHYLDTLKKFAEQNNLSNRIHYLHTVSFADLPAIYQLSKAFVYPSLFEGFGIPLVEAITCNTPVITSTGSCFSEAAGPDSLYVAPSDAKALATAINRVLSDSSFRERSVLQSKQFIQKFEPHAIARDMMQVYRSLVQ